MMGTAMPETFSILVIDDEEYLRLSLAMILKREGYIVRTAANIREARQYLQEDTYDLAFLDLKLPDGRGLTLLPELRSQFEDMPVLILTAHDMLESATEAVRLGARDYFLKPADPAVIIQRVKELLTEGEQPRSGKERYSHLHELLKDQRLAGSPKPQAPEKPDD
jgi:DNA-binding response OmpR family regulator